MGIVRSMVVPLMNKSGNDMLVKIRLTGEWAARVGAKNQRTFRFKPGVNLLVGPNGSGKSTVITAIMKHVSKFEREREEAEKEVPMVRWWGDHSKIGESMTVMKILKSCGCSVMNWGVEEWLAVDETGRHALVFCPNYLGRDDRHRDLGHLMRPGLKIEARLKAVDVSWIGTTPERRAHLEAAGRCWRGIVKQIFD